MKDLSKVGVLAKKKKRRARVGGYQDTQRPGCPSRWAGCSSDALRAKMLAVSITSRNGAPAQTRCVFNGQMTKG